jgi:hypothetical protein
MIIRLHLLLVLLIGSFVCGCDKTTVDDTRGRSDMAATNSSNAKLVQPFSPTNAANNNLTDKLADAPPDVLSATNIEQWKSLIPNLRQDSSMPNFWMTKDRQKGVDSVVLISKGQSIVYKTESVDVNVLNDAGDVLEAEIYTPKMDIVETRELGLKICKMFGFDSTKFDAWCKSVGNNWLDAPLTYGGDNNHNFRIRNSYNDQKPWIMIFAIQPEPAHSEFMREFERQAALPRHP